MNKIKIVYTLEELLAFTNNTQTNYAVVWREDLNKSINEINEMIRKRNIIRR